MILNNEQTAVIETVELLRTASKFMDANDYIQAEEQIELAEQRFQSLDINFTFERARAELKEKQDNWLVSQASKAKSALESVELDSAITYYSSWFDQINHSEISESIELSLIDTLKNMNNLEYEMAKKSNKALMIFMSDKKLYDDAAWAPILDAVTTIDQQLLAKKAED